jgi:hypothetical protein
LALGKWLSYVEESRLIDEKADTLILNKALEAKRNALVHL